MSGLAAVVETVGVVARVASEGEEVELVTVGEFAVRADGFDVFVHGCVGWLRGGSG